MYSLLPVPGTTLAVALAALSILEIALFFAGCYVRIGRRREYLLFSLMALCLASMLWTSLLDQQPANRFVQLCWMRAEMVSAIWFAVFLLHFVRTITCQPPRKLFRLRILVLLGMLLTFLSLGTRMVLQVAPSQTAIKDVFDDSQGGFFYPLCFFLLSGGLYASVLLWRSVWRQRKPGPSDLNEELTEDTFSLARFLKRIVWGITGFVVAFAAELYNDLTPSGWEWEIIPRTLASFCFCALIGGALWSEVLRLQILRRRTEALAQARFQAAYDAQHQIKNGLALVQLPLQNAYRSLQRGRPAAKTEIKIRQSLEGLTQLETTLSLMLDMARIEAGRPPTLGEQRKVEVVAFVRDLCLTRLLAMQEEVGNAQTLEALLAEYFTLDIRLTSSSCYVFQWSLEQVLSNLLDNALKYSPQPHSITVSVREADSQTLEFGVSDLGVGIASEDLERIFEQPFYRGETGAAMRPGTGIGLNLARRYVQAQGGRLWARSEGPGQGSTFYVAIPLQPSE